MGDCCQSTAFRTLHGDEIPDQFDREDTAFGQIGMVFFKAVQCLIQRGGQTLQLCLFRRAA